MNESTRATAVQPLVKRVVVGTDLVLTFQLFTERVGQWWPLVTHSVGGSDAVGVHIGSEVGAFVVETTADGQEHVWGTVTHWEPPVAVAFTWHPGRPEGQATRVEVRFREVADGTEVELTHDGWQSRDDGKAARRGYDSGWDLVLGRLVELASRQGV
jgi:hypothetical protein